MTSQPPRSEQEKMAAPGKAAVVLKAVKRIVVHFSPFEHNVRSTRYESLCSLRRGCLFMGRVAGGVYAFATQIQVI